MERITQFLKERRFDNRGYSENRGLVLTAQIIEDLATWVKSSSFRGKDWELRDIVSGYGCQAMSAGKADSLYTLLERLLDNRPTFVNFIKTYCFTVTTKQYNYMFAVQLGVSPGQLFQCKGGEEAAVHRGHHVMEGREKGVMFTLPRVVGIIGRMRSVEDREKCESQIAIVTNYIEDYFLRR